jgi:4-methyl-5(b-hydroxyethyl)-thiazole monophosphate biosynthesis
MARVLIPIATGFEELEAVTIIDLLRRAKIEVVVAGLNGIDPVVGSRQTKLVPDTGLDEVLGQDFDMIVLPGGLPGADNLNQDPRIIALLQRMQQQDKYTAAICAAPKVLASAGILENKAATSFPGHLEALDLPSTRLLEQAVVIDGKVITSRGPGTAMDFSLQLIETLGGKPLRDEVEAPLQRP